MSEFVSDCQAAALAHPIPFLKLNTLNVRELLTGLEALLPGTFMFGRATVSLKSTYPLLVGEAEEGVAPLEAGKGHPKVTLSRLRTDFVLAEYVGNFNTNYGIES